MNEFLLPIDEAHSSELSRTSAYGGPNWSPRTASLGAELGTLWGACGVCTEWAPLRSVLLHRPGAEIATVDDPDQVQMLGRLDLSRAQRQHDAIAASYKAVGVAVHYVEPVQTPPPNLMFVADLLFLTPEGAIVGRPASTVRAGEERWVAERLAALGIPILHTVRGLGTFEGADAAWIDRDTVVLATGPRTNPEGASQVADLLRALRVQVVPVALSPSAMHLMGVLRLVDRNLALAWPGLAPSAAVEALRSRGWTVHMPICSESELRAALNFVALGPRHVLMPAGFPRMQNQLEDLGIEWVTVQIDELAKGAGGIGCMTGVLERADR